MSSLPIAAESERVAPPSQPPAIKPLSSLQEEHQLLSRLIDPGQDAEEVYRLLGKAEKRLSAEGFGLGSLFSEKGNRTVLNAIITLRRESLTVSSPAVLRLLSEEQYFEEIGAGSKLADITGQFLPVSHLEGTIENLISWHCRREREKVKQWLDIPDGESKAAERLASIQRLKAAKNGRVRQWLSLKTPSELRNFQIPDGFVLVGDNLLTRGGVAVLAGPPGCGKSRAAVGLAIAGATGWDWMGLETHKQFRTIVIQAENGPVRLKSELEDIGQPSGVDLDQWLLITEPPLYGFALDHEDFREQLKAAIAEFRPGLLVIDPWNRAAQDDRQRDYRQTLDHLFACLPEKAEERPAVLIIHHLRKSAPGDSSGRKRGRELLSELAGSYAIGSAARTAFVLQAATPDQEDDRVVFECAKANDGKMPAPTAWHRRNGLFAPCQDFDFESYYEPPDRKPGRREVTSETLEAVFSGKPLTKPEYLAQMKEIGGFGKTAAYDALKTFAAEITDSQGVLRFSKLETESDSDE